MGSLGTSPLGQWPNNYHAAQPRDNYLNFFILGLVLLSAKSLWELELIHFTVNGVTHRYLFVVIAIIVINIVV